MICSLWLAGACVHCGLLAAIKLLATHANRPSTCGRAGVSAILHVRASGDAISSRFACVPPGNPECAYNITFTTCRCQRRIMHDAPGLAVTPHSKCARAWHRVPSLRRYSDHATTQEYFLPLTRCASSCGGPNSCSARSRLGAIIGTPSRFQWESWRGRKLESRCRCDADARALQQSLNRKGKRC